MDSDLIYEQAMKKLRTLMANEYPNDQQHQHHEAEEGSDGSFQGHNNNNNNNNKPRRFVKRNSGGMKKQLYPHQKLQSASWHNLVHIDEDHRELGLIRKQESYIKQLEKEVDFSREQLTFVLHNFKDVVLNEDHHHHRGQPQAEQPQHQQLHGQHLKSAEKLRKDNELLTEALTKMRSDLEELKMTENEAAEQVIQSIKELELALGQFQLITVFCNGYSKYMEQLCIWNRSILKNSA